LRMRSDKAPRQEKTAQGDTARPSLLACVDVSRTNPRLVPMYSPPTERISVESRYEILFLSLMWLMWSPGSVTPAPVAARFCCCGVDGGKSYVFRTGDHEVPVSGPKSDCKVPYAAIGNAVS
jgi:hypothetical protein